MGEPKPASSDQTELLCVNQEFWFTDGTPDHYHF